ncbi:DUF6152 family protein [Paracoccus spongiarum]|uniref:DUF6152 family protein n=1 Tax=Paracoccus spongiarum TaxID=3064387 RepID=A0ABT9JGS9_9RHOB|nr:DUF6152 family protein [Paracoccus sp. 2205BS29-5]MDP5308835.1 DUF6152 family protein [Paracoccus sp. 2205BS29-5]
MPRFATARHVSSAALVLLSASAAALAHHGWSWAEGEVSRLTGTIARIVIAPPHPTLTVEAADGTLWTVELGNPGRTQRSGFVEGTAAPGDRVTVLGNRAQDSAEPRMKAVRITVEGRDYDMYPERIPPDA